MVQLLRKDQPLHHTFYHRCNGKREECHGFLVQAATTGFDTWETRLLYQNDL
jgi:hypothetical protein